MDFAKGRIAYVPVPVALLGEAYAWLAGKSGVPEGALTISGEPGLDDRAQRGLDWTDELVTRSWVESPPTMKLVLRELATHAGEWLPSDRLAELTFPDTPEDIGRRRKFAGALGAWGHRCSSRYKVTTWPFEVRWNSAIDLYEYRLDAAMAELFRKLFE